MPALIVQSGKHKGKRFKISGHEVLIGRGEECRVRIGSSEVSREHCLLTVSGNAVTVRDLGSQNGTFVNGQIIDEPTMLQPGDIVQLGPMAFKLEQAEPVRAKVPNIAPELRSKKTAANDLSDDEIASWLSDGEIPVSPESDTAIIAHGRSALDDAPTPPRRKRRFASVADEAADIIRRHKEHVAAQEQDEQ